jgi:asparagine synthase (glutamine-hydrolysing)
MRTPIGLHIDWSSPREARDSAAAAAGGLRFEHLSVVADARIDNAAELSAALGAPVAAPVEELLARGYLAWGAGLSARLSGDFAFVIWDARRQALIASRDPFGVKPLSYRSRARAFWFASDVAPLLATFPQRPRPNDRRVVEYLLSRYATADSTFFDGIDDVAPGHTLTISDGNVARARDWRPPVGAEPPRRLGAAEFREEFLRLFLQAVQRRTVSPHPVIIHVSGGLDSSSIAGAADALLRSGRLRAPAVRGVAARYPGLPCDESPFVAAAARHLSFPVETWDGMRPDLSDLTEPAAAAPGIRSATMGGTIGDVDIARAQGATTILSGLGGDQLGVVDGFVLDLIAQGRWSEAYREVVPHPGMTFVARARRAKDVAKQYLPQRARKWIVNVGNGPPSWLVRDLWPLARDLVPESFPQPEPTAHVSRRAWRRLTAFDTVRSVGALSAQGRPHGVEYLYPFLDKELVHWALAAPLECWPQPVAYARLHREPLAGLLPPEVARRFGKAEFTPALAHRVRQGRDLVEGLLADGPWASARYVGRQHARELWRAVTAPASDAGSKKWRWLWSMMTLEAWLRSG